MINNYLKLYKKYFLLIILFIPSCEKKTISNFDHNIKELIDWSSEKSLISQTTNYAPINSDTLAEILDFQEHKNIIHHKNGIILGYFIFESNKIALNTADKDLLILISKAQKYENFNILIESNDIKFNLKDVMDEVKNILLSNGVKNNKISLNSMEDANKAFVIKIIKLIS